MTGARVVGWVELSGENPALARAELAGAAVALGGRCVDVGPVVPAQAGLTQVEFEGEDRLSELASRLALARRVLRAYPETNLSDQSVRLAREGTTHASAAFRPLGGARAALGPGPALLLAEAYRTGGGTIDLETPTRRFWTDVGSDGVGRVFEEVGAVDRVSLQRRRMPRLPYQRPVSLPPRLGRVVANLGAVRPGDPVVDPFVGTGALLLEAALLGARISGVDRSAEMVRGALENLRGFGVDPDRMAVADAAEAFPPASADGWAAILTDPPYGRASGSGGEPPAALLARVLPRWAHLVRPGGRVVVVVPGGPDPLPPPWVRTVSVPDRVHRSLTREFRVYERSGATVSGSRTPS